MFQWGLPMSTIKVTLIDKEESDTYSPQASREVMPLSTWPMPEPAISNQIIPKPTQALSGAYATGDKAFLPLPEFGQEVPFPATRHPAKGPPLCSSWKTNACSRFHGQADPRGYRQQAI